MSGTVALYGQKQGLGIENNRAFTFGGGSWVVGDQCPSQPKVTPPPVVTMPQAPVRGWVADLPKPFESPQGVIQNLVERPVGGVSIIVCLPGTRRSSHWHKTDWHYLFVRKGEMKYWERPAGSSKKPTYTYVGEGEMIFTPPNVEHFTEFPIGAELISMHSLSRTHEAHEADLVRVEWFE